MSRGSRNAPLKLGEMQPQPGGMTPVAKLLLPRFAAALPIRLTAAGNSAARRIAQFRRRVRPV